MRPEIPASLLDELVGNRADTSSIPQHIRENNALDNADGKATATAAAEPTTTSYRALLRLCRNLLKNDFEHQCFEDAVRMLGGQLLTPVEGDIGPRMLRIPGIPNGRFLPYQVWGVWFIVERILADRPPVALMANDIGLGKTHCTLAILLYLKYIINHAEAGRPLSCLDGKLVAQLERVPRIFGAKDEIYRRPAIIIVPANLDHAWERAAKSLIGETRLNLTNLHSRCDLTRNQLNYSPDNPERGTAIHLISYTTYRTRYRNPYRLLDCQ